MHSNTANDTNKEEPIRNIRLKFATFALYAAADKNKDQSYFLWTLTQAQLAHCLFPIGDYTKPQVRALARKFGLPNAEKKDSQGICFLGQVTLDEFLADFIPAKKGAVITTAGRVIGEHKGAQFFTIGQRRGLGVGGSAEPLYVSEKNVTQNLLTVAVQNDPALCKKEIMLSGVNLISPRLQHTNKLENIRMLVWVRVRYRQPLVRARLEKAEAQNSKSKTYRLVFDRPQKFIAPGQSAVFYAEVGNPSRGPGRRSRELRLLGGGIIAA